MFDIDPSDIAHLSDKDLRELIGRLCESELSRAGLSPSAVTWGGSQTAADGGLDVRVALPANHDIAGFIPRNSTGFQVKVPDMPRADIIKEMRPHGELRSVINDLIKESGSYILVSSRGSTSDISLENRRKAMREALDGAATDAFLHTDFYDRTRIATWVRQHPGIITWVKQKLGKSHSGWSPYDTWSGSAESLEAEYLNDDTLRLSSRSSNGKNQKISEAIDEIRDLLNTPGRSVRLVGLSGVGKTRLAQALFDSRVGLRPLDRTLAIYTDLSNNPDPQPIKLASDLIANHHRAILVIDNCPPDLHRRLSELCSSPNSSLSVLSIEYDVREDQQEVTETFELEVSSQDLIETLITRRYPELSKVDARTIAEASGGNARIAIALADTVEATETIAGISSDDLFQRLFRQRQESNENLLRAAQVFSLVYSFNGENLEGSEAELPLFAHLAGISSMELYRSISELTRRNLIQHRSVWRAVLPHAIANRLAAHALQDIPLELITRSLVDNGTDRLAKSFSRRLSYLHDNPYAISIVKNWLSTNGLLNDIKNLTPSGVTMFQNVASVRPGDALTALERLETHDLNESAERMCLLLLRSLAYEPEYFTRAARKIAFLSLRENSDKFSRDGETIFSSLFTLYLSGTHAKIEQRLALIEELLCSDNIRVRALGLNALRNALQVSQFSSHYEFSFGARSRDYGYIPELQSDVYHWYSSSLRLIARLGTKQTELRNELKQLISERFPSLWRKGLREELEHLYLELNDNKFWPEGWASCRRLLHISKRTELDIDVPRLLYLESRLKPAGLFEQVQAFLLTDGINHLDVQLDINSDDDYLSNSELAIESIIELGRLVSVDKEILQRLLPELFTKGRRGHQFGRGLAHSKTEQLIVWSLLRNALISLHHESPKLDILQGFLYELSQQDLLAYHEILDSVSSDIVLRRYVPELNASSTLDDRSVDRLKMALHHKYAPVRMYSILAGGSSSNLSEVKLDELLSAIAKEVDGFPVALDIFQMRLFSETSNKRTPSKELLEVGQRLLTHVSFAKTAQMFSYELSSVLDQCLSLPSSATVAASVANKYKNAISNGEVYAFDYSEVLQALLDKQPQAVLDEIFADSDSEDGRWQSLRVFEYLNDHRDNPINVLSNEFLQQWCSVENSRRYEFMAEVVSFQSSTQNGSSAISWSDHAITLMVNAPDPLKILQIFIERFQPNSWSGSRASITEVNARLLDVLPTNIQIPHEDIAKAKIQINHCIIAEREWETKRDVTRNERFE